MYVIIFASLQACIWSCACANFVIIGSRTRALRMVVFQVS